MRHAALPGSDDDGDHLLSGGVAVVVCDRSGPARAGSAHGGGGPLRGKCGRALTHRGVTVPRIAQQRGEPVAPMLGERGGHLGNEDAVNTVFHTEAMSTGR